MWICAGMSEGFCLPSADQFERTFQNVVATVVGWLLWSDTSVCARLDTGGSLWVVWRGLRLINDPAVSRSLRFSFGLDRLKNVSHNTTTHIYIYSMYPMKFFETKTRPPPHCRNKSSWQSQIPSFLLYHPNRLAFDYCRHKNFWFPV